MEKVIKWNGYNVKIIKRQVKNLNFRIKPSEPNKIYVSISMKASYDHAIKLLDDLSVSKMLEKHKKNLGKDSTWNGCKVAGKDWCQSK